MPTACQGGMPTSNHHMAADDLCREFGERREIAAIAQGYRAILREKGSRRPVVLYGRTPAELAESVRMAQVPL
jgi:hypothetical protein